MLTELLYRGEPVILAEILIPGAFRDADSFPCVCVNLAITFPRQFVSHNYRYLYM